MTASGGKGNHRHSQQPLSGPDGGKAQGNSASERSYPVRSGRP